MVKLKLHSRIAIPVEFSDVGVVEPDGEFEIADARRAEELVQLGYAELADDKSRPTATTKKPRK